MHALHLEISVAPILHVIFPGRAGDRSGVRQRLGPNPGLGACQEHNYPPREIGTVCTCRLSSLCAAFSPLASKIAPLIALRTDPQNCHFSILYRLCFVASGPDRPVCQLADVWARNP